jgi:V/A-type H+-transporting ATPase subunit D
MMTGKRMAPTRINLLLARRRLAQVERGASLVRRKRDALVRELFRLAHPAADVRVRINMEFADAYEALLRALAHHGRAGVRAIGWPARPLAVRIEPSQIWGINVADITDRPPVRRMLDARGIAPGTTGPTTSDVTTRFEALAELLLDAAAAEQRLRRIGDAVAEQSRHLRTLEQRLTPELESQITGVKRVLQEREREEYLRLKHLQKHRPNRRVPR